MSLWDNSHPLYTPDVLLKKQGENIFIFGFVNNSIAKSINFHYCLN